MLDEKIIQVKKLRQELQQYQNAFEGLPQIIVNPLEGKNETRRLKPLLDKQSPSLEGLRNKESI